MLPEPMYNQFIARPVSIVYNRQINIQIKCKYGVTGKYGGIEVTSTRFFLSRGYEIISRGHEIISHGHKIDNSFPQDN